MGYRPFQVIETNNPSAPRHIRINTRPARTARNVAQRAIEKPAALVVQQPQPPPIRSPPTIKALQPYQMFLVLDVEATCDAGSSFDFPNEIIVGVPCDAARGRSRLILFIFPIGISCKPFALERPQRARTWKSARSR